MLLFSVLNFIILSIHNYTVYYILLASQVINAQLPVDSVGYLHRAGRTARMGKHGTVLNLLSDHDAPLYNKIKTVMDQESANFNDTMKPPPRTSRIPDQIYTEVDDTGHLKPNKRRELEPWLRDNPSSFVSKIFRSDFEIK